jgi:outer membrane protein TolC
MRTALLFTLAATTLHAESINLPTVLRLAGAETIQVKRAEEKLAEAQAEEQQRVLAFLPTLTVGAGYRNHQGALQDVVGTMLEVDKHSYNLGATAGFDLSIGEAVYRRLAAKQKAVAASKEVAAQKLAMQVRAAMAYFDLVRAQASIGVAQEAVNISRDYGKQVMSAVEAGVAFKGDALKVDVQTKRNEVELERARGLVKQGSVALAEALRLDPSGALIAADTEPKALELVDTSVAVKGMIDKALAARPELARELATITAVKAERDAVVKGQWVPTLTAQAFGGALDGGIGGATQGLRDSADYFVGFGWKIGAGGLFDKGRRRAAESRLRQAELNEQQTKESITADVVAAVERAKALASEVKAAREAVKAAEENNKLSRSRQEFAVGIVLETVVSEQDLTRARLEYLEAVTAHNAAQFALQQTLGAVE